MCKLPHPRYEPMSLREKIVDYTLTLTPFVLAGFMFGNIIYQTSKGSDILLENPLTIRDNDWDGQILVYDHPQDIWPNYLVDENMDWIPDYREWESVERVYDYMRTTPTREDSLLLKNIEGKLKKVTLRGFEPLSIGPKPITLSKLSYRATYI